MNLESSIMLSMILPLKAPPATEAGRGVPADYGSRYALACW